MRINSILVVFICLKKIFTVYSIVTKNFVLLNYNKNLENPVSVPPILYVIVICMLSKF